MRSLRLGFFVTVVALGISSFAPGSSAERTLGVAKSEQSDWAMTYLGTLGGRSSTPRVINDRGQVVGTSQTADGDSGVFIWKSGRMSSLGRYRPHGLSPPVLLNELGAIAWSGHFLKNGVTKGVPLAEATALNNRGQIVGARLSPDPVDRATLWENGRLRDLGTLPNDDWSLALAINDAGVVVGRSARFRGNRQHGFVWKNGKMRELAAHGFSGCWPTAINDRGQAVGACFPSDRSRERTFLWVGNRSRDLGERGPFPPDRFTSIAPRVALNERGEVALTIRVNHKSHPGVWRNGSVLDLGTLGGSQGWVADINDLGHVVGTSLTEAGKRHAFIWKDGVMTSLLPDAPSSPGSVAIAINNRDQIIGVTVAGNVARAAVWSQR